jgi:hypothetical protein
VRLAANVTMFDAEDTTSQHTEPYIAETSHSVPQQHVLGVVVVMRRSTPKLDPCYNRNPGLPQSAPLLPYLCCLSSATPVDSTTFLRHHPSAYACLHTTRGSYVRPGFRQQHPAALYATETAVVYALCPLIAKSCSTVPPLDTPRRHLLARGHRPKAPNHPPPHAFVDIWTYAEHKHNSPPLSVPHAKHAAVSRVSRTYVHPQALNPQMHRSRCQRRTPAEAHCELQL